jgi:hypothetical protein
LIEIAPELLREDSEFNHLLEDLDARIVDLLIRLSAK